MAVSFQKASIMADDKKKMTPEELTQADKVEAEIDAHIERTYDGNRVVVSIARPAAKVLEELERRYVKAGWKFVPQAAERQGFSIVLSGLNSK